jgi:polysaccharide export outer membrane protein
MSPNTIKKANLEPYKRRVIDAGDLDKPAKILASEKALVEIFPQKNNPGPYKIGVGDVLTFTQVFKNRAPSEGKIIRTFAVKEDGLIYVTEVGRIKASGLTLTQLEDKVYERLAEDSLQLYFEIAITEFNSKKITTVYDRELRTFEYISMPMFLEYIVAGLNIEIQQGSDIKITVLRSGFKYVLSLKKMLANEEPRYRLFPNDVIIIEPLNYRAETVLMVGETGAQRSISINSVLRPTLAETIFSGSVLNSVTSDFSQIYVLRKKSSIFHAYHLDITNPTRVSLASKFEMRPDDIVFVATQPLSLYSRTLSQILGSSGLTLQARDTIRAEMR